MCVYVYVCVCVVCVWWCGCSVCTHVMNNYIDSVAITSFYRSQINHNIQSTAFHFLTTGNSTVRLRTKFPHLGHL